MNLQLFQILGTVAILESLLIVGMLYLLYRTKIREWILRRPEWWFWGRMALDVGLPRWNYEKAVLLIRRFIHFPLDSWEELIILLRGKIQENLKHQQERQIQLEKNYDALCRKVETQEEFKIIEHKIITLTNLYVALRQDFLAELSERSLHDLPRTSFKTERYGHLRIELSWLESRSMMPLWIQLQQLLKIFSINLIDSTMQSEKEWQRSCFWKTNQCLSGTDYQSLLNDIEHIFEEVNAHSPTVEHHTPSSTSATLLRHELSNLFHPAEIQIGPIKVSVKLGELLVKSFFD
jgi:hypothetical protein